MRGFLQSSCVPVSAPKVEAQRIWDQIGVHLDFGPASTDFVYSLSQWDLPDDAPATKTAVTGINRRNGIDVYIVNSISIGNGQFLSGSSPYKREVGLNQAGVIVATRKLGPTSTPEKVTEIARTVAHEIGHYLLNTGDHTDDWGWNLMLPGAGNHPGSGTTNNSDLNFDQRRAIALEPGVVNADEE